jgi:pyridoxal phosphate enzyme (YggS family)
VSEPSPPGEIAAAIGRVRRAIREAADRSGRPPSAVRLIGVSKWVDLERVRAARAAGLEDFGENRAGELAEKASAVPDARWHFLGRLQRGTAARVADHAAVIHSAVPGDALRRVAGRAERAGRSIPVLLQVDLAGRGTAVAPEDVGSALDAVAGLAGVALIGLMTIPPPTPDPEGARPHFARLRAMAETHRNAHPTLLELSMGMSADYPVAVEEGATMVRVGRALFGARPDRPPAGPVGAARPDPS